MLSQKASIKNRDGEIGQPTAQKKYVEYFKNDGYANFNINYFTDIWPPVIFLNKTGISSSPRCSLCDGQMNPLNTVLSLSRLLRDFGLKWCSNRGVVISHFSAKDILFGKTVYKDNLFINHILLVGKQYIYYCRYTKTNPCLRVFLARLSNVYQY